MHTFVSLKITTNLIKMHLLHYGLALFHAFKCFGIIHKQVSFT